MCDNHKQFMQAAIEEAEKNLLTNDGGPFGAVIVKDGKIIARGHNEVLKNNDAERYVRQYLNCCS